MNRGCRALLLVGGFVLVAGDRSFWGGYFSEFEEGGGSLELERVNYGKVVGFKA